MPPLPALLPTPSFQFEVLFHLLGDNSPLLEAVLTDEFLDGLVFLQDPGPPLTLVLLHWLSFRLDSQLLRDVLQGRSSVHVVGLALEIDVLGSIDASQTLLFGLFPLVYHLNSILYHMP